MPHCLGNRFRDVLLRLLFQELCDRPAKHVWPVA
jgi:hypothetical protein